MSDPVKEVEDRVNAIIVEHLALWGCDDPVCAIASSTYLGRESPPLSWWRRLLRWSTLEAA